MLVNGNQFPHVGYVKLTYNMLVLYKKNALNLHLSTVKTPNSGHHK